MGDDLIILVDIVWLFISPLYDRAEHDGMQWIYNNLRKGGYVLFELEDYFKQIAHIKRGGSYRFWEDVYKGTKHRDARALWNEC